MQSSPQEGLCPFLLENKIPQKILPKKLLHAL